MFNLLVFLFPCFCHCGICESVHPVRLVSFCWHHQVGTLLSQGSKIETSDPGISVVTFYQIGTCLQPELQDKKKAAAQRKPGDQCVFSIFQHVVRVFPSGVLNFRVFVIVGFVNLFILSVLYRFCCKTFGE